MLRFANRETEETMTSLVYCKQHDRNFGTVCRNPPVDQISDIDLHLWGAHNVPVEKCRGWARRIAIGETDFPSHYDENDPEVGSQKT